MYIQRVSVINIAVGTADSGNKIVTTVTLPSDFTPTAGTIYDFLINAQVPTGTDGTILSLGGADLLQRATGNYARARNLAWRKVIRAVYFDDPAHYALLAVRG